MNDQHPPLKFGVDVASGAQQALDTEHPHFAHAKAAARAGEIHTITTGTLEGHNRASTCWCVPTQHPKDGRIWTHRTLDEVAAALKSAAPK